MEWSEEVGGPNLVGELMGVGFGKASLWVGMFLWRGSDLDASCSWNISFVRDFNDWELPEVLSFFKFIHPFLPSREIEDKLVWPYRKSGQFDVRSFYGAFQASNRGGTCGCVVLYVQEGLGSALFHCEVAAALWGFPNGLGFSGFFRPREELSHF
uniref:Uncharacterized protein n=1 Tax=Fagus sylvatica TaxID=28930 RepID=A0A2N9FWN3_FAGSY